MATEHDKAELPTRPPLWNDPKARALVFQVLVLLGVAALFIYITYNTLQNMQARGISTGFDFLSRPAGFGIAQTLIEYTEAHSTYGRTFLIGLLNTLLVSFLGIILATVLGFIIGVARLSGNWLIARLATAYVEFFRNIPLLLQILFWYFAVFLSLPAAREAITLGDATFLSQRGLVLPWPVPEDGFGWTVAAVLIALAGAFVLVRWARRRQELTGQRFPAISSAIALIVLIPALVFFLSGSPLSWDRPQMGIFNFTGGLTIIPELAALLVALSVYTAAFIAETVRAGILAVSHGQTEAAYALGLKPTWTMRLIIVPQAMRVIIPPLTSQYLNLTKNSSLATAIGYPDLFAVFAGTTLNQTGQAFEVIAMTMAVYLSISLLISLFMNWYNARMALVER